MIIEKDPFLLVPGHYSKGQPSNFEHVADEKASTLLLGKKLPTFALARNYSKIIQDIYLA